MDAPTPEPAGQDDLARIAEFNATEAPFQEHLSLQEIIERTVDSHPDATAVICDHDPTFAAASLSFAQLNARVNQLAHRLRTEGVQPGSIVGLMVERSFAMAIGVLGIVKAGGAYLPISPDSPRERVDYMLTDGGVNVLLVQKQTPVPAAFRGRVIVLDDAALYTGSTANPVNVNTSRDLAYVIYTSGSTGRPKGVMIEHRSVINRLRWMQRAYPIQARDVILQKTPFFFDVSVWELFWWALEGARVCFLAPGWEKNPLTLAATIKKQQVTVLHFVPSMLNVFLDYFDGKPDNIATSLASVRQVFASGEALTPSHVRKFNSIWGGRTGARLTNLYGPTEATVDVSYFDCPVDNEFETIPIGRPIDNTRLYILRNDVQVPIGQSGELCIGGMNLARGYLNNPNLTAQKFTDNPANPGDRIYRTGDLARWLPDGNIEYLGREDHQVKIRGLRIELGEIESTIRDYPGVGDCVAVVKPYSEEIVLIIAYLTSRSHVEIAGLKQYLKERLPDYMIPNQFEKIDMIPLSPSGKADRGALPEPAITLGSERRTP